ncbi:GNAT family N-acetyltransferase [Spirochaeta africana]|uniref:GNAT family N-acetyltransferase n=1 Tax=Spirochaeta africana (strain ATCC 700263 / DSM 8902 / Z-7692) TaxID=889378 RepID=H9UJX8_SPIAZ|nr:GNAT family N-acetyltransferase [Spirochaeta africana]AFG37821.1 hypothetical protein Spiaf_1764 [Spirochaeta africana DSM 8902]
MDTDLNGLWLQLHRSIHEIPRADWQRLAVTASPLMQWDWLAALEDSGSVSAETDWAPRHAAVRDADGVLIAAAPFYRRDKSSAGEFVFDFAWIDAAEQLGFAYFPKLVGMSPATPIPAFEILMDTSWCQHHQIASDRLSGHVLQRIREQALQEGIASIHLQFVSPSLCATAAGSGFQEWRHAGFEWHNRGYRDWDHYLEHLTKDRRRTARRERRRLREQGVVTEVRQGSTIPHSWLSLMYRYYRNTTDQFGPWAARFLRKDFFLRLHEAAGEHLVFVAAFLTDTNEADQTSVLHDAEPVALAMLLSNGSELMGRYWGCSQQLPYLHFECCYYTPIEWAIQHGISRFNPGMGGEHKIHRGFEGARHFSQHWFADQRMALLFAGNIHQFNDFTQQELAAASQLSALYTLRKGDGDGNT